MVIRLVFLIFLSFSTALADYVEVRKAAVIFEKPERGSVQLSKGEKGSRYLISSGLNPSYTHYPVIVEGGGVGWILRSHTVLILGAPVSRVRPEDTAVDAGGSKNGYAARHNAIGTPQSIVICEREGYVLAHDSRLKIPLWVQYKLSRSELNGPGVRKDNFTPDAKVPPGYRAELSDYEGSGFDRGHMAPAEDMDRSQSVMDESFFLSNMAPQVGIGFNRAIWAQLEKTIRRWVANRGELTIITGPIFKPENGLVSYKVIGESNVAVPAHFYKIVVDATRPNKVEALGFVFSNESHSGAKITDFLASIDSIEEMTGLDFLSSLPVATQIDVESSEASSI